MAQTRHRFKSSNEGMHVGCGMEERWVLFCQQIGHFPGTVFRDARPSPRRLERMYLRRVHEYLFLACDRIQERGEKSSWRMGYFKGQRLDVAPDPFERDHARRSSKSAAAKFDTYFRKEKGCCADAKVVAGKSQRQQVLSRQAGQEDIASAISTPELNKRGHCCS